MADIGEVRLALDLEKVERYMAANVAGFPAAASGSLRAKQFGTVRKD